VTPVSEIGPYRFKPGRVSETLMNDYSAEVLRHGETEKRQRANA
jgi:branched-chain amino acid aminotransferase